MYKFKSIQRRMIILLLLGALLFPFQRISASSPELMKASIDSRIELLYIIDVTSSAGRYSNCQPMNTVYLQQAMRHFSPYYAHTAISFYRDKIRLQFDHALLEDAFLSLPVSLSQEDYSDEEILPEDIREFLSLALSFYWDSQMALFLSAQTEILEFVRQSFQSALNRQSWQNTYRQWFSESLNEVRVILSPLKTSSHRGSLYGSEAKKNYVLVLGLTAISNGFLVFASMPEIQQMVMMQGSSQLILHEMEKYQEYRDTIEALTQDYEELWKSMNLDSSAAFLAFHMGNSLYCKLMEQFQDTFNPELYLDQAYENGLVLIREHHLLLDYFILHPEVFSDFSSFVPLWMEKMIELLSSES